MYWGGVQNQAEQKSKNDFRPYRYQNLLYQFCGTLKKKGGTEKDKGCHNAAACLKDKPGAPSVSEKMALQGVSVAAKMCDGLKLHIVACWNLE